MFSKELRVGGQDVAPLRAFGLANFQQSGGSHTIGGPLFLGVNTGASSTYNLSAAAALTVGGAEYLGYQGGTANFVQSGGSHLVAGTMTIASSSGYTLSGGTLSASVVNHGSFTLSGGMLSGTLDDYNTFTDDGGSLNGSLLIEPSGTMTLGPGAAIFSVLDLVDAPDDSTLPGYIAAHVISANPGNPAIAFYDPSQAANTYLDDQTYALGNGGYLSPTVASVPEPWWLGLVSPLAVPCLLGRRTRRRQIAGGHK